MGGHSFDLARQRYVNLAPGGRRRHAGDTVAMVQARERFLSRGHLLPLAQAVAEQAARHDHVATAGLVLDSAAGTGYYLAAVLSRLPHRHGICLDVSPAALRRAARAHPRAAAVGADVWHGLPLADGSAVTVINVFGPHNAGDYRRIMTRDATLVVASPAPAHLSELIEPLGLITVDPDKAARQAATFDDFDVVESRRVEYQLQLDRTDIADLVGMGPSAVHVDVETATRRAQSLPDPATVTVAVEVVSYRHQDRR